MSVSLAKPIINAGEYLRTRMLLTYSQVDQSKLDLELVRTIQQLEVARGADLLVDTEVA